MILYYMILYHITYVMLRGNGKTVYKGERGSGVRGNRKNVREKRGSGGRDDGMDVREREGADERKALFCGVAPSSCEGQRCRKMLYVAHSCHTHVGTLLALCCIRFGIVGLRMHTDGGSQVVCLCMCVCVCCACCSAVHALAYCPRKPSPYI